MAVLGFINQRSNAVELFWLDNCDNFRV